MKFTIARKDLQFLVKHAGVSRPKAADLIRLEACAARIFVHTKNGVAGIEAIVLQDGAVTIPAKTFSALLKTYDDKFLHFEADAARLKINNLTMSVLGYDPAPVPPGHFQVFPASGSPGSHASGSRSS
jgi:hypothetical protein